MPRLIDNRRAETQQRLDQLVGHLDGAAAQLRGKGCVYLTGSFARGEASAHSDLDLFIVGQDREVDGKRERRLSRLDEICVKADLIRATHRVGIPEFSGDGAYLVHYTIDELVATLGRPEDDANNTFTARMLLLLESRPLLGAQVHADTIERVVDAYFPEYEDYRDSFIPACLANDILRMWRTFCVNYEARTHIYTPRERAKRRLKNYKLKHSRLLTCYSTLACLSALYKQAGTVHPRDVRELATKSPTKRLQWIGSHAAPWSHGTVERILESYEAFLEKTDVEEDSLVESFMDPTLRKRFPEANALGEHMAQLLSEVGEGSKLHRMLLV